MKQIPVKNPALYEISAAIMKLSDQHLHVYQMLVFQVPRLTTPEGRPLKVYRGKVSGGGPSPHVRVENPRKPELFFETWGEDDEEIVRKAKMLIDGEEKEKPFREACCCYAERISCVCFKAFKCELHGETHIGTHD